MAETGLQDIFTLQIRRQTNNSNPSPYCEACKNGYVHVNSLQVRQFTQSGKLPGVCRACNEAFLKICRLQIRHLTQTEFQPHECKICNKTFTHAGNFKKHMLQHEKGNSVGNCSSSVHNSDKPDPPYICEYCSRQFLKYKSFQKHVTNHTAALQEDIKVSNATETDQSLEVHSEIVYDDQEDKKFVAESINKPFKCDRCGKGFLRYGCLLRHHQLHEADIFVCKICREEFKTKPLLSSHMRVHKHICKLCKEAFALPENLEVHLQNHMQEQSIEVSTAKVPNYECSICHKTFVHIGFYQKHLRTMHPSLDGKQQSAPPKTQIKLKTRASYNCSLCNHRFRYRRTLKKHMAIHNCNF